MTEDIHNNKHTEQQQESTSLVKDDWMIKGCEVYDDEYSDCCSIKSRFNQYFIFGKFLDCSQWKRDSINCYKWVENQDLKAANELVQSEKNRRRERLLPHYTNDIWKRRVKPPDDWNKPLPEEFQREYEHTYLNVKAKEMRGEIPPSFDVNSSFSCSIM